MKNDRFDRRAFLKSAVAGSAAAATVSLPRPAEAQQGAPAAANTNAAYAYLNPEEAAFVEALVDHMVPADQYTGKGTDLGLNTYIDRALAGGWGKGERLYMQGPWRQGVPSQGYQLPLTPATLYQNVMEGMFADPIYGGNRNKAGWKLIGFPGVIAVHYQNVEKYRDKKYSVDPVSISDMS